jgi:general secretion pathway protein C
LLAWVAVPARLARLRRAAAALLVLWCCLSLVRIAWSLLPAAPVSEPPATSLINPALPATPAAPGPAVDIERAVAWHLFGEAGALSAEELRRLERQQTAQAASRDRIEEGARETRLALVLRGIVAADEDGLGYAMIEHRSQQELYAVGDELPVSGRVVLAKVLPDRVVIDNGGTYELLSLFEETPLTRQAEALRQGSAATSPRGADAEPVAVTPAAAAAGLAAQYRERLYSDPQSLAEVVRVAAVREGDSLVGYRVSPGRAGADFAALGFEPGDIVTGVNGLSLSDPANTIRLYQTMRDAREAVFDLRRDGRELSLSVRLAAAGEGS